MEAQWFEFMGGKFLIKAFDPSQILALGDELNAGRITEEKVFEELFKASLMEFEDIPGGEKIPREKKAKALFRDLGVRNFVLSRALDLLHLETESIEKNIKLLERFLLLSGNLKS